MKLEDKGPIVKPPVLEGPAQKVSVKVQSWKEVIAATHWTIGDSTKANGADFYVSQEELGHIHLDGELHMPLTKKLCTALIKAELAQAFPYARNWVQFEISDASSARHAEWLFKLGYDRLQGTSEEDLLTRIAAVS